MTTLSDASVMLPATLRAQLQTLLGPQGWVEDPATLAPRLTDWRGRYHGDAPGLARPNDTQQTSELVRLCAQYGVAITPQGGNTGLVGGATPQGEILLITDRMRAISVDAADASLTAQAGAVLADVHAAADDAGRLFPLSLASQGSATIGGLLSANAGGVGVLRYGMMRELTLGLEAVLPDGQVWNGLRRLRKDNLGYDLKHLLIGSEGTLGVITAATLRLFPKPKTHAVAFASLNSPADAVAMLRHLQDALGDTLTAFELLPRIGLELVMRHIRDVTAPVGLDAPWFVLAEASVYGDEDAARDAFEAALMAALAAGTLRDAAVAQSQAQRAAFWKLRETLPEAEKKHGKAIKHDVATPVSALPAFMDDAEAAVRAVLPEAEFIAFGHVGDGNIHFNVVPPTGVDAWSDGAAEAVSQAVHDVAASLGGSAAAEHGVGVLKRAELARLRPGVELSMMRAVKQALDPRNIMNPRVMFLAD